MNEEKTILIITDGTEKIAKTAKKIAANLKGNRILIKNACDFAGTDLLPAHILFIGCDEPSPPSFAYLDEMLQHINLAGRSCGIFSSSKKAANYLSNLLKDSEISLKTEPLPIDDSADIPKWIARVIE